MKRLRWDWKFLWIVMIVLVLAFPSFKWAKAEVIKEKRSTVSQCAIDPNAAMEIIVINSNGAVVYKGFAIGKKYADDIYTYWFEPRSEYRVYLSISTEIYMISENQPNIPLPEIPFQEIPLNPDGRLAEFQTDSSGAETEARVAYFLAK